MEPSYKVLRYWWSRIVWATSSANSYASSKYDSIAQRHQPQRKYRHLHWGCFVATSRDRGTKPFPNQISISVSQQFADLRCYQGSSLILDSHRSSDSAENYI